MKIGFDLDKIFIGFPPLVPERIIEKLYIKKTNGELSYRIPGKTEQLIRQLSHISFFRPEIKENIEFLRTIPKDKHKLFLISSRFSFLKKQTLSRIKELGLDRIFDGMYFNFNDQQPHQFKNNILKKLKLDLYIDDDIHLLNFVSKDNPKTIFLWLNNNSQGRLFKKNISKILSIYDILPWLK